MKNPETKVKETIEGEDLEVSEKIFVSDSRSLTAWSVFESELQS